MGSRIDIVSTLDRGATRFLVHELALRELLADDIDLLDVL
jgi:hypothetical protein